MRLQLTLITVLAAAAAGGTVFAQSPVVRLHRLARGLNPQVRARSVCDRLHCHRFFTRFRSLCQRFCPIDTRAARRIEQRVAQRHAALH